MTLTNWLRGWIVASVVAPAAYLAIYWIFGYTLGEGIVIFWPSSIGLMVLENGPSKATVVVSMLISIAANALVYFVIGLLLWPFARVKSQGVSVDEKTK